jgi:AraC-like DNA-binding protein
MTVISNDTGVHLGSVGLGLGSVKGCVAMALISNHRFVELSQYQSALRAVHADAVVSGKGRFKARLTSVTFPRLWMQSGSENLPRVARLCIDPSRAPITFQSHSKQPPTVFSGKEVSPGDLIFFSRGESFVNRTAGLNDWSAMSLDPEALTDASHAITGRDLTTPRSTRVMRPAAALVTRLTDLHRRVMHMAVSVPERLAHPEVARAVEHEMVHLMVRCLADHSESEDLIGNDRPTVIIRKFHELAIANPLRPLHLAEVCAGIGVSERTLMRCCNDQLGLGPIRFLWLRRMGMVRAALARADAMLSSVTEIATAHGFWELGRFAVNYRRIYGESPSQTLARTSA